MAVTSLWPIKGRVDKVIAYVRNPEKVTEEYLSWKAALHVIDGVVQYAADDTKTERMEYVTGVNCAVETATEEFLLAKRMWHKEDGRLCYHGYQSFKPGEVDARMAHQLKHPTITPPGGKKNFRLDSLGEGYDLRSLINRVNANKYADPPFQAPQKRFYRAKTPRKPTVKLTGLRALYFKYCCKLGIVKKHPERQKQVSWQLREDLIKLDRYIAEAKLLLTNKIETMEDLAAYKTDVEQRIGSLEHQRTEYRKLLRRIRRDENTPTDEALRAAIHQLSDELKQARKELEYCADIAQRSEQARQNLYDLQRETQPQTQRQPQRNHDCLER